MAHSPPQHQQLQQQQQQQQKQQPRLSHEIIKASTAVTIGGSLLLLSGLTLVTTVVCLTVATPVLVLFSPVLVPAAITAFLVLAGMMTSGGLGTTAVAVMWWMYSYVAGKHPIGADKIDHAREKLVSTAMEVKDQIKGAAAAATTTTSTGQ